MANYSRMSPHHVQARMRVSAERADIAKYARAAENAINELTMYEANSAYIPKKRGPKYSSMQHFSLERSAINTARLRDELESIFSTKKALARRERRRGHKFTVAQRSR